MSNSGLECHYCWQGTTVRTLMYAVVPLTPSGVVMHDPSLDVKAKQKESAGNIPPKKVVRKGLAT